MLVEMIENNQLRNEYGCNSLRPSIDVIIEKLRDFESKAKYDYLESFTRVEMKKGAYLLHEGKISNHFWFLESGLARSFVQKNGQEISCDFFFPSEFIDVYDSSTLHLPSPVNIQLLADSVLYSVEWERWEILVKRYPVLTEIEKIIIACYNKALRERIIDFQSLKAKDRYIKLLQTNHNLLQQASIAQIASYMGVKVETLSRIRSKIIHLKF